MRTRHILYTLAATLTLFSCVKELIDQPTDGSGDGTATRITLAIKSDSRPSVGNRSSGSQPNLADMLRHGVPSLTSASRALTPEKEELIDNVHILVFDAAGAVVANEHFDGVSITGTGSVNLETLPGDGMQIVVVANGDVNDHQGSTLDEKLKNITLLEQLKTVLVDADGDGLKRTDRLMMVGTATVNITKPHNATIPVDLHFLDTKVTLTVTDNITALGESITITGWDVVNIPKKSHLIERTAPEDAVNGSTPTDYTLTNGKYAFESINPTAKTWAHTVYLFENRRGGRVEREDPTNPADKYPGMGFGDNNQRGKAWYAPPGATYMLVYGTYTKNGQMNNVVYKVYLGENPVDDYNLFRGKHYNYNVTINGLNDINVDTNVEWGSASFSVDHSDNLLMDAHPDFRVFRIAGTAVDGTTPAYATVEVFDADGATPCTWLWVSPLNLYRHAVKQSGNDHQQFASANGVGSFVRTRYTPTPTAESEFATATFGVTRKLTKIPFYQPAVYTYQNVIVYADSYDGTTERTAKVTITYYKGDQEAGKLTYDVTQSGAIRVSDDLYIERYEECAMLMHPGLASGLQQTQTMQWGYSDATLYAADDRFTNGNWLTANAVYNTVAARSAMEAPAWTANASDAYRAKYPRTGAKVVEPSGLSTTGTSYFYPELTSATLPSEYFHPVFNSSAARYCHEKNRDKDGDGIISATETVWYLPSFADMWYISQNMPADVSLIGNYWTATEESNTNSWGFNFPANTGASAAKTAAYRVRCVKGKGAIMPNATIESTETDKTKINLAATAGASGVFNIKDNTGLPWTVASDASWLTIATSAAGASDAAAQSGTGNKTLYAYATAKNSSVTDTQSAKLILTRTGNTQQPANTITVTRPPALDEFPEPHKGWAGCNVYWDETFVNTDGSKGRLTFDDVGVTTHQNYQGVFFKWGSLVAISPMGHYNPSTSILFSPTEAVYKNMASIPYADTSSITPNDLQDYLFTIHDPELSTGDICRYITERGWAPGPATGKTWRIPIGRELLTYLDYKNSGNFAAAPSGDVNGTLNIQSGATNLSQTYFPAGGYLIDDDNGIKAGTLGFITSSSWLGSTTVKSMQFRVIGVNPVGHEIRMASSVRCVLSAPDGNKR